jgi:hypothetical protein
MPGLPFFPLGCTVSFLTASMIPAAEDLKALHDLMTEAHQNRLVDAALIANRLMQSGALLLGAVHSRLDADALKGPAAIVRKARDR